MSSKRNLKSAAFMLTAVMGVSAVVIAQQDGLQPPPGPVMDTQPSLFSLGESIAAIQSALTEAPANEVFYVPNIANGTTATLDVGQARIERIIMGQGAVDLKEQGVFVATIRSGSETVPTTGAVRLEPFTTELGIVLNGPIEFTGADSAISANIIVVYREIP